MAKQLQIEQNPDTLAGKPVIASTRITVAHIFEKLSDGFTLSDLLESRSCFERNRGCLALAFAAATVSIDRQIDSSAA